MLGDGRRVPLSGCVINPFDWIGWIMIIVGVVLLFNFGISLWLSYPTLHIHITELCFGGACP
jgi:hypothetical protein